MSLELFFPIGSLTLRTVDALWLHAQAAFTRRPFGENQQRSRCMDVKSLAAAGLLSLTLTSLTNMNAEPLPEGWLVNGGLGSWLYTASVDRQHSLSTHGAKRLQSNFFAFDEDSFSAISQHINPVNYRGKRIRLSAMLSTEDVHSAYLYIRADTAVAMGESLAQTENAGLHGTQSWHLHELVIDVPRDAILLSFGLMQVGLGSSWMDSIRIDVVDNQTPLTRAGHSGNRLMRDGLAMEPVP